MKRQWVKFPWDLRWGKQKHKRGLLCWNGYTLEPQPSSTSLFRSRQEWITVSAFSNYTCIQIIKRSETTVLYCLTVVFWRVLAWNKSVKCFHLQGSCRVLTHLSKKTAKLNRSAVDQGKSKAILPVIPVDETDRRRALYTGNVSQSYLSGNKTFAHWTLMFGNGHVRSKIVFRVHRFWF